MSVHLGERWGGFWRSVTTVLMGTAMAQAIPLFGSLLLARLYAPAEFGLYAAWLGMVYLAGVVVTGRYEAALAVEPDGGSRRIGVQAVLLVVTVATGCILVLTALLAALAPAWLRTTPLALLWAFAPTAGLIAASQVWQSWAAAEGRYADLIRMRISQAAGITGIQLGVGMLEPSAASLGLAHCAGVLLGAVVAATLMPLGAPAESGAQRDFLRRHRRFPMLSLPADSVNAAASQLPLLLVASRFGNEAAGLLALALRTMGAPIALLGVAVLDVFKRQAADAFRKRGECRNEYLQTLQVLALGSVGAAVVIGFLSEDLFALAFGEQWRAAGTIALWLLPMFAMRFVASPLSYVFYITGKQQVDLLWQCALLVMTLAAFMLPGSFQVSIRAYAVGYACLYVVYLILSYRYSTGKSA